MEDGNGATTSYEREHVAVQGVEGVSHGYGARWWTTASPMSVQLPVAPPLPQWMPHYGPRHQYPVIYATQAPHLVR